jgi:DNA-binding MarR family transcriptional regulator
MIQEMRKLGLVIRVHDIDDPYEHLAITDAGIALIRQIDERITP